MKRGYLLKKIFDYCGVVFLLAFLYFLWVLYNGPLSVPFLKPYIIEALNSEQNEFTMNIGEVNLELVRSIQPVKIIAKNVILKKNDGDLVVNTPKLSLSFSVRALLNGMIAPSSITIHRPKVSVFTDYGVEKDKENEVNRKKVAFYFDWFQEFIERFNSSEKIYPESYINNIQIKEANIELHEVDLGHKWQFSDIDLNFNRSFSNLELSAAGIVDLDDRMATLDASVKFNPLKEKLILNLGLQDVVLSDFIKDIGAGITNVEVPMSGQMTAYIDFEKVRTHIGEIEKNIDSAIEKIEFQIEGNEGGIISFENDKHFDYKIDAFALSGEMNGGIDSIELKNAHLVMENKKVELQLKISGYQKYFFEKSLDDLKIHMHTKTEKLPMNELARFWPRYFAEPAWEWCKENLYGGEYQNADFTFEWTYDEKIGALTTSLLKGKADIVDGTISYLEGMPEVSSVYGTARFDIGVIDIDLHQGFSDGIKLQKGKVKLYDLDKDRNYIDIHLQTVAPTQDVLRYIDYPPLEFTKDLGLDPKKIEGMVDIDLGLNFELYQDLSGEDIKVQTKAVLKDVVIKNVLNGKDLKSKKALLKITEKELEVKGDSLLDDMPIAFHLKHAFKKQKNQTTGQFRFVFDENLRQKFNLSNAFLSAPYLEGKADVVADLILSNDEKTTAHLSADLKDMTLNYSFLGLEKNLKEEGKAQADLLLEKNMLKSIPSFRLTTSDFNIDGQIKLGSKGQINTLNITHIQGPKTSASAKFEFKYAPKETFKATISGSSYNLTRLFDKREEKEKEKRKKSQSSFEDEDLLKTPNAEINIAVDKLWTTNDMPIHNFTGSALLKNGVGIEEMHVIGNFGTDKSIKLTLDYTPKPSGDHYLNIESNNAGSTLRVLRLYEDMSGGILKIEGRQSKADSKLIGHAKIRDFRIHNTPVLAKLLTVASFSGMLDLLKGDGLVFSHFDAPFSYQNEALNIQNAKMFGNVLGITLTGNVNRATSVIDMKGIISPAYSINSMASKIPLIGSMLAGRDGTIFALNYTISDTIENPNISINPFSILSPNSIKDLFAEDSSW